MKRKTILKLINRKINDWLLSIEDKELRSLIKDNIVLTGGAFASMLLNEKVKDYDIYFKDRQVVIKVAEYYLNKYRSTHPKFTGFMVYDRMEEEYPFRMKHYSKDRIAIFIDRGVESEEKIDHDTEDVLEDLPEENTEKEKYRPIFFSTNAITLSNGIQITIRFYGNPDEIHETYDYVHCTNYWTSWNNELVLQPKALESIITKTLTYTGSKYPLCSVLRMRKFIRRGWQINAGQVLKMLFQVSLLDLKDIRVLEDQLVGVDTAYFNSLIEALQSDYKINSNFVLDESYLSTIIDRIFGD